MIRKDQQNTTFKNDEEKIYFTNIIKEVNFQGRGKRLFLHSHSSVPAVEFMTEEFAFLWKLSNKQPKLEFPVPR